MLRSHIIADRDFRRRSDRPAHLRHLRRDISAAASMAASTSPAMLTADANGFRGDVLALTASSGRRSSAIRAAISSPATTGKTASDPRRERPARLDLAWGSTETNQFGTNEFIDWCRAAEVEPMFGGQPRHARRRLRRGTSSNIATIRAAPRLCGAAPLARLRAPHDIKFWCLGNEMDGPWQICAKTAAGIWPRRRRDRQGDALDRSDGLQLAACGSSFRDMPTYGAWEHEVLDHCFDAGRFHLAPPVFHQPRERRRADS